MRASGWLVFLLKTISRVKDSFLVGVWKGHSGISWIFNGVLFSGVSYMKSCVFFYCSTLSQLYLVFTPYSCQWRDCTLGELLISFWNIIMPIILFFYVYSIYFTLKILSGVNTQNNSCKHVEQWRNSVISHYLVVNHCNADDFELGEPLIVHFWL